LNLPADPEQQTLDQIRVNIAFEQMVVAVLAGAASGGAMTLVVKLARAVFSDFSFAALLAVFLDTLLVSFLIFLVGFFASVAVGAPLFMFLEKRKRRTLWPYLAAALAVAIMALMFAAGDFVSSALRLETMTAIFAPAIVIALIFARLMKPHWRAAEKAEAEAAAGPIFFRLH
jgi:hypothetical protein